MSSEPLCAEVEADLSATIYLSFLSNPVSCILPTAFISPSRRQSGVILVAILSLADISLSAAMVSVYLVSIDNFKFHRYS